MPKFGLYKMYFLTLCRRYASIYGNINIKTIFFKQL